MIWRLVIVALLGLTSASVMGQLFQVDTLRGTQPWGMRATYTFPVIVVPGFPEIADKINGDLCVDFLDLDPHVSNGDLLSGLWGEESSNGMSRISSFTWTINAASPIVLVIELSGEFCAAYCEGSTTHYLYDIRNGSRMDHLSVFTADGVVAVNAQLQANWRRMVSSRIEELEIEQSSPGIVREESEAISEALELYRVCMETRPLDDPYIEDMIPTRDGLRFVIARCSSHVDRAIDNLDAVSIEFKSTDLLPHLRPWIREAFGW